MVERKSISNKCQVQTRLYIYIYIYCSVRIKEQDNQSDKHTNSRPLRRCFCDMLLTDWTTIFSSKSSMKAEKAETRYYSEKLKNILNLNLSAGTAQSV